MSARLEFEKAMEQNGHFRKVGQRAEVTRVTRKVLANRSRRDKGSLFSLMEALFNIAAIVGLSEGVHCCGVHHQPTDGDRYRDSRTVLQALRVRRGGGKGPGYSGLSASLWFGSLLARG